MVELGIEPGTSWLVVRSSDHQTTRLVFDPRTVQPVAGRYTDCAIPPHSDVLHSLFQHKCQTEQEGTNNPLVSQHNWRRD